MHLQQPNIHSRGPKINIRQDFLLASELFIDDLFLIKKRERHTTFLISTAMILCLSLSTVVILLISHRRGNAPRAVSTPPTRAIGTVTVTAPPPVAPSVTNKTPVAPPATVTFSRPRQSATGKSTTPRVSPGATATRTPAKTAPRKTGSSVTTRSPDPKRSTTTRSAPASERSTRAASTSPPKKQHRRQPESSPVFTPSDAKNQFDRSAFYMPADDKNSSARGRASRSSSSRGFDNSNPPPSMIGNKANIVANIAQLYGGQLQKTLEHNGDYYKLKLFIPKKQLLSFKKDVAKMVEYASYTSVPEESKPNTTCLIMETHFR